MPPPREVVITGLGVVCPIGVGTDAFWAALEARKSGVDWLPELRGMESPSLARLSFSVCGAMEESLTERTSVIATSGCCV